MAGPTTLTVPERPSPAASPSVLNQATHTRIQNSSFSITTNVFNIRAGKFFIGFLLVLLALAHTPVWSKCVDAPPEASLDALYHSVAMNAILNSGGRADEVRCHPGTREEVIRHIEGSMDTHNESVPRLLWLSGPAGAGKTAIMQTLAERYDERGVPHANFFFFRADGSRNDSTALVATLMHQIIQLYPPAKRAVAAALASNPLLFQTSIREQFNTLMHLPFRGGLPSASVQRRFVLCFWEHFSTLTHLPFIADLSSTSIRRPFVLLLDGLDECDSDGKTSQVQILQALDTLLAFKDVPFRIVVASRKEPQITMAFKQLRSRVGSIFLDKQYSPEKDIHRFVTAQFDKIKSTHHLADKLSADWPSDVDVADIVTKSSGQFIFAATAMRFIAHSSSSPVLSLRKAQGILPPAKNSPFANIDAVYSHILEQVDDADVLMIILASTLVARDRKVATIRASLQAYHSTYSDELVDSCIAELSPLARVRKGRVQFYHASFADFLQDKSRAGRFYIDIEAFSASIFPKLWKSADWTRKETSTFARFAFERIELPNPNITALFTDTDRYQFRDDEMEERNKFGIKLVPKLYGVPFAHLLPLNQS